MYLLNLISGKDWMVHVGAYCIRHTDTHVHGKMIDPTDTSMAVSNIPISIRDKCLINMYLLNHVPGKDWMVYVGAYCIHPSNFHDHGQMIDPPDTCWDVCNISLHARYKFLINTYLLNPIPGEN